MAKLKQVHELMFELGSDIRIEREVTERALWFVFRRETKNPRMIVAGHDVSGRGLRDDNGEIMMKPDPNDWRKVGEFDDYDKALTAAQKLIKEAA